MGKKITQDGLNTWLKKAKDRQELRGDIPGFFYIKLATGGAWRLRYTDLQQRRVTATIADGSIKPHIAAQIAESWRQQLKQGIDPQALKREKAEELRETAQTQAMKKYVNTGVFFREIYTPHMLEIAPSTAKANLNLIEGNFSDLFDRDMDKLTATDIRAWEKRRKLKSISRATLQRGFGAFKAMLNYAAGKKKNDPNDEPVIERNPFADVNLSRKTELDREQEKQVSEEMRLQRDLLGSEEREKIQKGLELFAEEIKEQRRSSRKHGKAYLPDLDETTYPHWFIPFAHIARLTGMRPSDIRRLRWSDIRQDFRAKVGVLVFTPNKTAHHNNPVEIQFPIAGELTAILNGWREQKGNPEIGLMFPSPRTGGLMDKNAYQTHWARVKELGEARSEIHFYCYRHNFISDLVNHGFPLMAIAKLVGHKTTDMIAKNYYRGDLDDMAGMVAALSGSSENKRAAK